MKNDLQKYLKSLNPKDKELVYGIEYKLYKNDKFIGKGVWTKDENVGDSFQRIFTNKDGENSICVLIPDRWEIIN